MRRERFSWMNDNGERGFLRSRSSSPSRSLPISSQSSSAVGLGVNGGVNYIQHTVSNFDTLAGVAIKYGVEVADIKRLNGLVTDLQMFALETLHIPLPGRHPPSPSLSNGHDTPQRPSSSEKKKTRFIRRHSDLFDSFQSLKSSSDQKISPAMSTLQGYYGLRSADQKSAADREGEASSIPNPQRRRYRKSKSISHGLESQEDSDDWIEKLLGRRQKSEADFSNQRTPEKILKEENSSCSAISAITGKGLALRPKSSSRAVSGGVDGEPGLVDSFSTEGVNGVRKSSSTSCLQDSDNCMLSSIWTTSKWNLKPDFQALSTAATNRPIFDGLPKPLSRRNKAAID